MKKKRVVLAYSGGLDTSVIVSWLTEQGFDVIALLVDLGQKIEDLEAIIEKGKAAGAVDAIVVDVQDRFVSDYIMPSIQMHAKYEGVYLLGTSLARPLIAQIQIEVAQQYQADYVSHGATGKGNDQARFEICYQTLAPEIQIIAPWKMPEFYQRYPGRSELLAYAKEKNIPVKATAKQPWSSDENLLHISFEAGMLEDPWVKPLDEMFEYSLSPKEAPNEITEVLIEFKEGIPVKINGEQMDQTAVITKLNKIGGENGIGRIDIVESRFVGMKSRGVYETPGGTILMEAHRAIESITLTKDMIELKEYLMPRFATQVYNGFWFTPSNHATLDLITTSQKNVTGEVKLELYKGNVTITGRRSPFSLYDEDIASMEKDQGNYKIEDAQGFIRLNALAYKIHAQVHKQK